MALGRDLRRISIHAPQWGATRYDGSGGRPRHFNPRTPVGCDVAQMVENGATVKISIHAPQWGATSRRRTGPASTRNFNPRTPVGCDGMWWTAAARRRYFNPRTPVGCDFSSSLTESGVEEFQSTHPSGVRRTGVTSTRYHGQFQSTHPSGVRRHVQRAVGEQLVISIHAPQWGATRVPRGHRIARIHFNPRTPVGCDLHVLADRSNEMNFNPRTPVGCDRENGHSIP